MDEQMFSQLRAQVAAQHIVLLSLIQTHPDRAKLKDYIVREAAKAADLQLTYPIKDSEIETTRRLALMYSTLAAI